MLKCATRNIPYFGCDAFEFRVNIRDSSESSCTSFQPTSGLSMLERLASRTAIKRNFRLSRYSNSSTQFMRPTIAPRLVRWRCNVFRDLCEFPGIASTVNLTIRQIFQLVRRSGFVDSSDLLNIVKTERDDEPQNRRTSFVVCSSRKP